MKNRFLIIRYATLFTLLIIISCNPHPSKNFLQENATESIETPIAQRKLPKSQSANPGDNVHCGLQDSAGNLWFGTTSDGLYKYDGKQFTQFTAENGLNSNTIWCMLEDKSGLIWIGTDEGIYQYIGEAFSKFEIDQAVGFTNKKYDIWSIMQDSRERLWFATGLGVFIYEDKTFTRFEVVGDSENTCKYNVEVIFEDNSGSIWFGGRCHQGVFLYDGKTISHIKPNGDDWAWPVLQDREDDIWFSSWKGAYRYDGKSFKTYTKKDGLSSDMVARIVEDSKGNLWFGGEGLTRYDGESFTRFSTKDGLKHPSVWTILEDNSGNLWLGTRETSLYLYDGKSFSRYSE